MLPHEYWALGDQRPQFGVGISISSFEHDGLGRHVYFYLFLMSIFYLFLMVFCFEHDGISLSFFL
jgi:hypothetical protein